MKIERVRAAIVRRTYDTDSRNTLHAWTGRAYIVICVETDDGHFGLGEVYTDGMSDPEVVRHQLESEVAPMIVGEDPRRIGAIRAKLVHRTKLSGRAAAYELLFAAVDIALWDLLGKLAGLPLHRLLGGASERVFVYASGGFYGPSLTPQRLAEQMRDTLAKGFGGVKIKGAGAPLSEDVARASALRDALGPEPKLMVDVMFAPNVPAAVRLAKALEPFDLHFLEAPTAIDDPEGWRRIADATGMPLAGPELVADVSTIRRFVDAGALAFLQYDVALAGGLTVGRELAALGQAHHLPITLHSAGSAVAVAASAHLGAAVPNCDSLEFHVIHQGLHEALWEAGWSIADGYLQLPDRPGLGLPFDFDWVLARSEPR